MFSSFQKVLLRIAILSLILFTSCKKDCEEQFVCREVEFQVMGQLKDVYPSNKEVIVVSFNRINNSEVLIFGEMNGDPNLRGIYLYNIISREKRFVIKVSDVNSLMLSKNNWIVFGSPLEFKLYKIRPDGSGLKQISSFLGHSPRLTWGNSIVFQSLMPAPNTRYYFDLDQDILLDSVSNNDLLYGINEMNDSLTIFSGQKRISLYNGPGNWSDVIEQQFMPIYKNRGGGFSWIDKTKFIIGRNSSLYRGDINKKNELSLIYQDECDYTGCIVLGFDSNLGVFYFVKKNEIERKDGIYIKNSFFSANTDGTNVVEIELPGS